VLDAIIRSAARILDAPAKRYRGSWTVDAWVFLNPHDAKEAPRRQLVQLFLGESKDLLYLSSTIGPYVPGTDLAPLLRDMVGALHSSLHLSAPDEDGVEHLRIGSVVETESVTPERLAGLIREVAVFADRFEAKLFGRHVDVR
jgi:hypothetical protein